MKYPGHAGRGVHYGLIFATIYPQAPPLVEYLGDMDWHLQASLDLDSRGTLVMGEPERALGGAPHRHSPRRRRGRRGVVTRGVWAFLQ
ncbi:MAG TPA: hypothetical protein VFV01_00630 [Spirillospora sp.]|nr:hypothetical protein [Spirillospora sp.]